MKTQKPITEEIHELRGMAVPELVVRYEQEFGKPPRVKHKEHIWRRIAWKIQERRFGGLSAVAKKRLDELITELDLPLGKPGRTVSGGLPRSSKPGMPVVGTVLKRSWRGAEIRAVVQENGIEHEGVVYSSLSAAAAAITGAHWNGRLFFGLTTRKKG